MVVQFGHPSGRRLLEEVRDVFVGRGAIYQRRDRPTIFVCGGDVAEGSQSVRAQFLRWAGIELTNFVPLLAEAAYRESYSEDSPEFINLSSFERLIAEVCDCVLIFPESVGSYAEMGLFSGTQIKRKILVANEDTYYNRDTFLNLGPIATIDGRSALRPAIPIRRDCLEDGFRALKDRLENRLVARSNRRQFHHRPYKDLSFNDKLIAVLATITLLRIVNLKGLEESIKTTFSLNRANRRELMHLLSLLLAAGYISRSGEYCLVKKDAHPLLEFEGVPRDDLVTRATLYYTQHCPDAMDRLREAQRDP
jgi:hypothetical protein